MDNPITLANELPRLLDLRKSPPLCRLRSYIKYVHRWRRFFFYHWMRESKSEGCLADIGWAVDQLISTALVLDYVKRQQSLPIPTIAEICEGLTSPTMHQLWSSLEHCLPCRILRRVVALPSSFDELVVPRAVLRTDWEARLADATWMLFGDRPVPLSLFGDFHQLCVANPLRCESGNGATGNMRYQRGIHYTPAPVVDYLVTTVLREAFAGRSLEEVRSLRILDPSCGCGAFLIASVRYIFNWLQSQASGDPSAQRLTAQEKLHLVENMLFGTDIDERAVAWTKRLLLLAVWETLGQEEPRAGELRLPQLERRILCRDFLDPPCPESGELLPIPIDVILGGPPFVRLAELRRSQPRQIPAFKRRFQSARFGQFDLYMLFVERALHILRDGGHLGFSVSNTFLRSDSGRMIRKIIAKESGIREIVEFDDQRLYPDAATQVALLSLAKGRKASAVRHVWINGTGDVRRKLGSLISSNTPPHPDVDIRELPADRFGMARWSLTSPEEQRWLSAVKAAGIPLGALPVVLTQGISTGADEVFVLREVGRTFRRAVFGRSRSDGRIVRLEADVTRPIMRGRHVRGFHPPKSPDICVFPYDERGRVLPEEVFRAQFPRAYEYLSCHHATLSRQRKGQGTPWYAPTASQPRHLGKTWKVICGKIDAGRGFTMLADENLICHESVLLLLPGSLAIDPYFLLGVLNSNLFWRFATLTTPTIGRGRHALRLSALRRFPLPLGPPKAPAASAQCIARLAAQLTGSPAPAQEDERLTAQLDREVQILYGIDKR